MEEKKKQKRIKHILVRLKPGSSMFSVLLRTIARRGQEQDIELSGISALRSLFSNEKARILHALKTQKHNSIYELAKKLGRDFKTLRQDLKLLEHFGFVKLVQDRKGRRKRLKPLLNLDRIDVSIEV